MHFSPYSKRFSKDMDYFHDTQELVNAVFNKDQELMREAGFTVEVKREFKGFVTAKVSKESRSTEIDWGQDSSWRFMPLVYDPECGYRLHPVDLAINKVLALAGRHEPRDYYDVLYITDEILPLGALVWAAPSKDPGFNPASLLEMLRRKGKYRPEDFEDMILTQPLDLQAMKMKWMAALDDAEEFIWSRPMNEHGCLYYSLAEKRFVQPKPEDKDVVCHYARPGGVLPQIVEN